MKIFLHILNNILTLTLKQFYTFKEGDMDTFQHDFWNLK